MNQKYLRKLARLAVRSGVNVQPGQLVVVNAPIEAAALARMINEEAYLAGAKDVMIRWHDDHSDHERYLHADPEAVSVCPDWKADMLNESAKDGACYIHIDGEDPMLMADIDPTLAVAARKSQNEKAKDYRHAIDKGIATWTIVPFAHPDWARKVYPDLPEEEAVEALWEDLFAVSRINEEDPEENWNRHHESFLNRLDKLNRLNLKSLHFRNSLGTDLIVELPETYRFEGGASTQSQTGRSFFPNIPTEEIFAAPFKTGVNGRVYTSMPLNHNGKLIDGFWLEFRDGKVTDFDAKEGRESLQAILEADEGSSYLGEAALVPAGSPINARNRIFYNTLIDENASCHLALGQSYAECVENGLNLSDEELKALGMNESAMHVDFMIGTDDLEIIGTDRSGKEIPIFEDGKFAPWIEQE